jgi:hypothetical protein
MMQLAGAVAGSAPARRPDGHFLSRLSDVGRLFHVTSVRNRESVTAHGLDWTMMKDSPGIAGSRRPEQDGCFLCLDESEVDWFVRMNNTGGPVDVWVVDDVDTDDLVVSGEGHSFFPGIIPAHSLKLLRRDIPSGGRFRQP